MNKLLLAGALCTFGLAHAQAVRTDKPTTAPSGTSTPGPAAATMQMPKPGPEQDALKPFVRNGSYIGTRMMPDGKEMPQKGKQTCKWLPGNMWAACDIDMSTGAGKSAMKWMGHLVLGYDTMAKGYRAVMTDNMGMMGRMQGTLDGKKMVWESMDEMKMPNMPSKERVTDDATDPKVEKMTFEGYVNGKWMPLGSGEFKGGAR